MRTPLYGHVSEETAHITADYPYGFWLRCRRREWIEETKHGFRMVTQTSNPKLDNEVWNKPTKSTYARIGGCLYMDDEKHVHWAQLSVNTDPEYALAYVQDFPGAVTRLVRAWAKQMLLSHEKRVRHETDSDWIWDSHLNRLEDWRLVAAAIAKVPS